MVRSCAVPKCKTGYKSVKEKYSVFSVPKNIEQFKKWQAAIPWIILKQSQGVCEKHFEEKYILKEWVGRDSEGRVIAQVPYKHRRLVESAVPTIFENVTTTLPPVSDKPTDGVFDGSDSLVYQCESFEEPLIDTPDTECADASCAMPCAQQETVHHEVLPVKPVPSAASTSPNQDVVDSASIVRGKNFVLSKITINNLTSNKEIQYTSEKNPITIPASGGVTEYAEERGSDKSTDGVFDGSDSLVYQCESFAEPLMDTPDAECADASCTMPCAQQETVQHEVLPVIPVPSAASTCPNQEVVDSASIVPGKNFVVSTITINELTSNVVTSKNNPITIPTSWGVTEYAEERGQRVVFSNILRTKANGTAITIIDRSVEVEPDKTLRYCVYGRLIDSERCQLPPILTDTALLPEILWAFRRLNVCQGLDPVNIRHLSFDCVFQDSVQRWRDNECTILAKHKRCEHCKKMRHCIIQRESSSNKTKNTYRIRHLSNPIDKEKLIALRNKNSRDKRTNNNLKRRVQLLTESLHGKVKEISSIRAETLDDKFSHLQIPASQQTVIKETISAATRRDTKSRRYSEDWIMLCILMHIRSPSYYAFLRRNNVLSLPCARTIRSYLSLINMKCGFAEQFGELLKKHFDTKTVKS